jgi:lipase chaperone LimK
MRIIGSITPEGDGRMAMNEARARKILGKSIQPDGSLKAVDVWADWEAVGYEWVLLDDSYTAEELEAIAWWMRHASTPR